MMTGERDDAGIDDRPQLGDPDLAVRLFRSLADPTRLAILQSLAVRELRVVELTERLGLAQSTVSGHLACLRDCGLVTSRPEGRASVHALATPELLDMLVAAERLLAATGYAVALCPRHDDGVQDGLDHGVDGAVTTGIGVPAPARGSR